MSIDKISPDVINFVTVIIRAFADEPVLLKAVGGNEKSIDVIGRDSDKMVSFSRQYVYCFDSDLFDRLKSAFHDKRRAVLEDLWMKAEHYEWK